MSVANEWMHNAIDWEPGDRVELLVTERSEHESRLRPLCSQFDLFGRDILPSAGEQAEVDLGGGSIIVPNTGGNQTYWLECTGARQFRLVREEFAPVREAGSIEFDESALDQLLNGMEFASLGPYQLSLTARRLASQPGFDKLIALSLLRDFQPLDHQTRTVVTALRRMRGKALLCDEVGLGKTIEAGLALLELVSRGLARSVLILVPPSLIEQWKGEMLRKFSLEFFGQDDVQLTPKSRADWCAGERVIASIHTAKREPYRSALLARDWDMVIIDEAHHLRNRNTQAWKFAAGLRKQFMLLLTATPVQNKIDELFNLVTLLEPGLLSTEKSFCKRFVDRRDPLAPKNVDELHRLLGNVMVRNRRSTVGLQFTKRHARTLAVPFTTSERVLYDQLTASIRRMLTAPDAPLDRMTLITLQMALGSSAPAAAAMLKNILSKRTLPRDTKAEWQALHHQAAGLTEHAKLDRLTSLIDEFGDKLVVFTQLRATQDLIAAHLRRSAVPTVVFNGELSRREKEEAVNRFREDALVLVSTQSGSEGRNLQFCNGLCNYDLPWNPMRIEQRVGRLSRIGQVRDVHVFNLVAAGTIEQAVLHLLEAKLNMFELVIGEIDMILGNIEDEREFADLIADEWIESTGRDEFESRMELLGERLRQAKFEYLRQKSQDEKLFGNRFSPDA